MEILAFVRTLHILTAILMAWPFYALVAVNARARLGPPLGDRVDLYLEQMIRGRAIPCFIFQATALLTGLALIRLAGEDVAVLLRQPALGIKFLLLLGIGTALAYVVTRLQPGIDEALRGLGSGGSQEDRNRLQGLRSARKRLAAFCLFGVLTNSILGVHAWAGLPSWPTLGLILAAAGFSWQAHRRVLPYGWL